MLFNAPLPFAQAAQMRAAKSVLPTSMSSAQLAQTSAQLRERSDFSARMENAAYLQYSADQFDALIQGQTDAATVRANLKGCLDVLGVGAADPDQEDTILDPRSDARLNLRINMEAQSAQGFGAWQQGQDPVLLDAFPAQELYRAEARHVERDWEEIWEEAGGEFYGDGRMIALKNDPIWTAISDFGVPYPPFKFGSGMNVRDVDRATAMGFGIIDRDEQIPPESRNFADDAGAAASQFDATLLAQLVKGGCYLDGDGVLHPSAVNVGTSTGAVKGWITRRQGRAIIAAAHRAATTSNVSHPPTAYARVDGSEAAKTLASTGLDIRGHVHAIDASAIRHILKTHGDTAAEAKRGQLAITQADFERLPTTIRDAQAVARSYDQPSGNPSIEYTHVAGETTTIVEVQHVGQKRQLILKTMYKRRT